MESTKNTAITKMCKRSGSFVPADVLSMFDADFLVEVLCRHLILEKLHPNNKTFCPGCGGAIPESQLRSFWEAKRIKCDRCGKYFTALTDTFLSGCHFNFREIVWFSLLLALGVDDKKIADILKISKENVRLWKLKFNDQNK